MRFDLDERPDTVILTDRKSRMMLAKDQEREQMKVAW